MRTLLIAAGIAAAVAIPAHAQTAGVKASTNRSTGSTFTTTNTTAASSVSSAPATSTTTSSVASGNAVPVQNVSANPVGPTTQTESAFRPGGPFSNDSGNSALGQSAGQTSAGTAVGNSSSGIGADGLPVVTNPDGSIDPNANPAVVGTASLVPEGTVSTINRQATTTIAVPVQSTPTPLFDQAARDGRAKEQARRARGDEPRVYGIAPNTERDLTHQMPDDRIIRY